MAGTDIQLEEKIKVVVSEPKRWKVILLNDDSTPMDFVVSVLIPSIDTLAKSSLVVEFNRSASIKIFSTSLSGSARFRVVLADNPSY